MSITWNTNSILASFSRTDLGLKHVCILPKARTMTSPVDQYSPSRERSLMRLTMRQGCPDAMPWSRYLKTLRNLLEFKDFQKSNLGELSNSDSTTGKGRKVFKSQLSHKGPRCLESKIQGAVWQRTLKRSKGGRKPTVEIEKGWGRATKGGKMHRFFLRLVKDSKIRATDKAEWVNTDKEVRGKEARLGWGKLGQ